MLQELVDKLDVHTAASQLPASFASETYLPHPMPRQSQESPSSPTAPTTEADPDHGQKHQRGSGGADVCPSSVVEVSSLVSLPNEGERWARLRNQMIGSPYFEAYLRKTEEPSSWSIDEAFASYCLDRLVFYGIGVS